MKILDELSALNWPSDNSDTFFGALNILLKYMKKDISYYYLLGISAKAFRIQFASGWNRESAESTNGFINSDYCLTVLGLDTEIVVSRKMEFLESYKKVESLINNRQPLLAYNLKDMFLWGLIIGYEPINSRFITKTYWDYHEKSYSVVNKAPEIAMTVYETGDTMNEREIILSSIELGIKLFQTRNHGIFYSGSAGYQKWIEHLMNEHLLNEVDSQELLRIIDVNAWIYFSLLNDRKALLKYLKLIRYTIGDPFDILHNVIDLYKHVVSILEQNVSKIPLPWAEFRTIKWDDKIRREQAKILAQVRNLESYAIEKLGLYLTTIEH
ncbi:MAG: hypothetical protein ACP6IS_10765 [Candidatus Asgardarchaeia archaeon]